MQDKETKTAYQSLSCVQYVIQYSATIDYYLQVHTTIGFMLKHVSAQILHDLADASVQREMRRAI